MYVVIKRCCLVYPNYVQYFGVSYGKHDLSQVQDWAELHRLPLAINVSKSQGQYLYALF